MPSRSLHQAGVLAFLICAAVLLLTDFVATVLVGVTGALPLLLLLFLALLVYVVRYWLLLLGLGASEMHLLEETGLRLLVALDLLPQVHYYVFLRLYSFLLTSVVILEPVQFLIEVVHLMPHLRNYLDLLLYDLLVLFLLLRVELLGILHVQLHTLDQVLLVSNCQLLLIQDHLDVVTF